MHVVRQLSPQTDGSASGDNDTGYICTFHSFCVSVLQEDSHAISWLFWVVLYVILYNRDAQQFITDNLPELLEKQE